MSDTHLGDIHVVGQRRTPGGSFPSGGSGGGGGLPNPEQLEVDPDPRQPDPINPCDDPALALEWNADAAAAEALRKMREKAAEIGEPDFAAREFGTAIYRFPDGSFRVGTVRYGATMAGEVDIWWDEYPTEYLIGSIHSHPSAGRPSPPDLGGLDYVASVTGNPSIARVYVVQPTYEEGSGNPTPRIFAYNESNRAGSENGPEVNQEGVACPGVSIAS